MEATIALDTAAHGVPHPSEEDGSIHAGNEASLAHPWRKSWWWARTAEGGLVGGGPGPDEKGKLTKAKSESAVPPHAPSGVRAGLSPSPSATSPLSPPPTLTPRSRPIFLGSPGAINSER